MTDPAIFAEPGSRPTLSVRGPAQLIRAVPFLLGFHPRDSVVIIGLRDSDVVLTARLDLADATSDTLRSTVATVQREGSRRLIAAVFAEGAPADEERALGSLISRVASRAGCPALDVLYIAQRRWWSLRCQSPGCCPVEGSDLGELSLMEAQALKDRSDLAALLAPYPPERRAAVEPHLAMAHDARLRAAGAGGARGHRQRVRDELFAACARAAAELDDEHAARFGVELRVIRFRDEIWCAIDSGTLAGDDVWAELARRLPKPFDAAPAFLAAWTAWRGGNGALASVAVERVLSSDPHYSAAKLLRSALERGINPASVPSVAERPARRRRVPPTSRQRSTGAQSVLGPATDRSAPGQSARDQSARTNT